MGLSWWATAAGPGRFRTHRAARGAKKGGGAAFDLSGDLSAVPTGYLVVALRRGTAKADILAAIAQELTRRGESDHWVKKDAGGTCCLCARRGLYIVGRQLYCRTHKTEAQRSPGMQWYTRKHAERNAGFRADDAAFEKHLTQRDKFRVLAKGRKQKA